MNKKKLRFLNTAQMFKETRLGDRNTQVKKNSVTKTIFSFSACEQQEKLRCHSARLGVVILSHHKFSTRHELMRMSLCNRLAGGSAGRR